MTYVSPYGKLPGIARRLQRQRDRLATDKSFPWLGTGLIADLEVLVQLLNLPEFAEWVRTHGPAEHQRFGDEIAGAFDACRVAGYASPSLAANVDGLDDENRRNEAQALVAADVREVLIETGALAAHDQETPIADLIRALLS